jgi:hypothetical protein
MSRFKGGIAISALLLAGCGSHVSASDCVVRGDTLSARITNSADKPVVRAVIQVDFYENYRFARKTGDKTFAPVLDPGTSQTVDFPVDVPKGSRSPMKCIVSRAYYGDGTTEDF